MKLTAKQDNYCQQRAKGENQIDSHRVAYPGNYSDNVRYVKASKMERVDKIRVRIEELKKPAEDILEKNRIKIIKKLIDVAVGNEKVYTTTVTALAKLIDKLLPTKTENKTDLSVTDEKIEGLKKLFDGIK